LVSCSGKKNKTYSISSINDSISENLFTSQNESKVSDKILHPIDSNYLDLFKKGDFDLIINKWENTDKNNSNFDSIEYKDFRMAIYYLSLLEKTHNADLEILFENYDTSCIEWTELFNGKYVYFDCFFEEVGFYMLQAFIVYDFENFHSYGLCNQDLHMNRFNRIKGNNKRKELFNSFESDFYGIKSNDLKYFDSLKTIYPYWSYIDSAKKYNKYAKSN